MEMWQYGSNEIEQEVTGYIDYDNEVNLESPNEQSASNHSNTKSFISNVQQGVPNEILVLFKQSTPFTLPPYIGSQVDAVTKGLVCFRGNSLMKLSCRV